MKTLQKNLLWAFLMLLSVSTFAQKIQVSVSNSNCNSGYSATLLLENEFAVEEDNSNTVLAAPSFALQINNTRGSSVSISSLSYSFKISNYSADQIIDFENFDYLNEAYIADGYSIESNGNGYDVEISINNQSSGSYFLIDERASVAVEQILDRLIGFYRIGSDEITQNNIGYTIEISNVQFIRTGSYSFETCATNYTKTVLLELEGFQKTNSSTSNQLLKSEVDNLMFCFPNPAKNKVYIQLAAVENKSDENYDIHIYNTNGQLMINQKWIPYKAVELNQLNKGIYNLSVLNNFQKIIHSDKLIIE